MKKFFTSLLLLAVGVVFANATSSLYVGSTRIDLTKDGTYTIGSGTATFTKSSRTLTLKNVTLTNSGISGYELGSPSETYYISLESELKITRTDSKGMGMRFDYSYIVITGNSYKITIDNSANTETEYPCIDAEESHFDIWNARLDLKAGASKAIYGNKDSGVLYFSRVYGDLKGDGGAIQGFKSATFSDCMLFTEGSKFVSGTGVTDANGTLLSELQIRPHLMVGTSILRTANSESTEGVGSWDKNTKTLTLGWDYTAPSGYPCIANYGVDGLVVKFDTPRTLTSKNASCIELYKPTTFTGSGKLTVNAGSAYTGIYPLAAEAVVTIDGCNFEVNAGYGIDGTGETSTQTNLIIKQSTIIVNAEKSAMGRLKNVELTGCCVNTAETPVFFSSSKGAFTDISGEWSKKVVIGVPTKKYRTDVCGMTINDLNKTNVIVPGLKGGKISYTPGSDDYKGTLTLDNVTLASTDPNQAVIRPGYSAQDNITITTIGENNLSGGHSSIYPGGSLTINGSGKLVCDATGSNYGALYTLGGNITITLDVNNTVKFENGKYGYCSNNISNEKLILKNASGYSDYYFCGTSGAMNGVKSLELQNMDFYSGTSGYPGRYFDESSHCIKENGGTYAKNVNFYVVKETYGITIARTPVTNCNRMGVGSKYITKGGATAVTFDGSKTLTLTDATINYGDDDKVCGIKNSNVDGLTIKLVGTNVITNSQTGFNNNNLPINIEANTTITGNGSLAVESLPVMTANNANLTFENAKSVTIASSLRSSNNASNSILTVDNSNVTVNKYVSFFKNVTWPNGKLLTPANGYYDTTERYIYDANGTKAQGVVFGDKNATAIDAVEFDNNAEVKTIYDAAGRETNTAKRGLNIIRMSDGSVRKVMVK